jgi:anthranilate synthase component 2
MMEKNVTRIASSVLVVDNYDSFTYNLVEMLRRIGVEKIAVQKNDAVRWSQVKNFEKIIFSPGPGLPADALAMRRIVETFGETKSILGVCLGHQAIAEAFGARLFNLEKVFHGIRQNICICDSNELIFKNLPAEMTVGLYHSWAVCRQHFPHQLEVTALSTDGVIMAFRHKQFDLRGVQFHPESYMTPLGKAMLTRWLEA